MNDAEDLNGVTQPLDVVDCQRIHWVNNPLPGIQIRRLQRQDISLVASLLSSSFYPQEGWLAWVTPVMRLGIYQDLLNRLQHQRPHVVCLVASSRNPTDPPRTSGSIVGVVEVAVRTLSMWPLRVGAVPYISNLAVAAPYRCQGIGAQLLLACERVAQDWGFQDLYLHAMADNVAAKQLYAKVGFVVCQQPLPWFLSLSHPQQMFLHKRFRH